MNTDKIKIQTWFVTGASSGIGYEMCKQLLNRGYNVIAVARRIPSFHDDKALCLSVDVTNEDEIKKAFSEGISRFGSIDVLINNAGISSNLTFEEISNEEMRNVIEVNYWGAYNTMKIFLPYFREKKYGTIINNTSQSGISVRAFGAAYCSSKHALEGLTAVIWHEAQRFCRVMAIELGFFPGTEVLKNHSRKGTQIPEYKGIPLFYKKYDRNFTNNLTLAINSVIDTVEKDKLPRRLILGKDALIQISTEVDYILSDLKNSKERALACSIPNKEYVLSLFGINFFKQKTFPTYKLYTLFGINIKVRK
ncbi:SDR family NAD(P)-dependent oxidoreductase [Desulfovibrio piger]|uniref:Oxidoreductase, short chain dehydrogenase/reductase family protein n=1 Tax=Desulfovibrio piger ATCC 29098 TaxID=411464 RepID=B6WU66_9BACT|nr:SDR family NAD(P)-dependent oxidoreductase [Desulfovibrio piger]EEB33483.1 oxidoreductase, short chain dehydrogenase/reductase family protein [Desulfovibrio piger ATCC 29098]